MPSPQYISKSAVISHCQSYRYLLRRCWDKELPPYVSGMLNPSTADADVDDATITRTVRRAASLGFGSIIIWNLYAYRARHPSQLRLVADPIGPENYHHIELALNECVDCKGMAVVGWGMDGSDELVISRVTGIAAEVGALLHCLGTTNEGHPRHPLYVAYNVVLQPWLRTGTRD